MADKRPRHYAQEIIGLKTRKQRNAALAKVPAEYQKLVKLHVTDYYSKKQFKDATANQSQATPNR